MDKFIIEVLPDGSLKTTVAGAISEANHARAGGFLRLISEMAGSKPDVSRIGHGRHEHQHQTGECHLH